MITQTSEYALRAVVFLAARRGTGPKSAQEIADGTRVPVGYLQKVLRTLARRGVVTAQRGSGGGFVLAHDPANLTITDVLRATNDGLSRIDKCPLGIAEHATLCVLHRFLDDAIARVDEVLGGTPISELIDPDGDIRSLCETEARVPLTLPGRGTRRRGSQAD